MLHFVYYSRISLNKLMQFNTIALLVIGFAYALKFGSFNRNLAVCMKHLYQCNLSLFKSHTYRFIVFRPCLSTERLFTIIRYGETLVEYQLTYLNLLSTLHQSEYAQNQ